MIAAFITVTLLSLVILPNLKGKAKALGMLCTVIINSLIICYLSYPGFLGEKIEIIYRGSLFTGAIPLRIDALSAWFIFIISFIFICGTFYSIFYLRNYAEDNNNMSMHGISLILLHASLLMLCIVQNSVVFLLIWEIMALSAFICVIFEHSKSTTLKAGINYLIQSHVAIMFLTMGFIWFAIKTGSYDFEAIKQYTLNQPKGISTALFLCFFAGFAIKAGFVPFHTWLPHAHPAAPSHISGIMSGVIIKIGIFGILRMLLLMEINFTLVGYFILVISIISGIYGVMLAITQHNLKKLLAYHSIENIGIIGIGIGLGCIGLGSNIGSLVFLGFAGALLHTLNHALFKSLLFFAAGNIYKAYHSLEIEHLGGVVKKMPHTTILFLFAAVAICGIPPFNGFVSEFIIYSGLYFWLSDATLSSLIIVIFTILALVFIGGLAMFCFTKAFGVSFLGNTRKQAHTEISEAPAWQLLPLYLILAFMLFIGLFPQYLIGLVTNAVALYFGKHFLVPFYMSSKMLPAMQTISWAMLAFVALIFAVYYIRKRFTQTKTRTEGVTWACGYASTSPKLQYTANSFARSYSKLFHFMIVAHKKEKDIKHIFPGKTYYETHPYDAMETLFIDAPIRGYKSFLGRFIFLHSSKLQITILYGILFVFLTICIPIIYNNLYSIFEFFKQL